MLNDEICKLREKLNDSIVNGVDYDITYKLSVELDDLIAKFYKNNMMNSPEGNKKQAYL